MEVKQEDENSPLELKCTLEKHHKVFQETPGLPPSRDHEHQIKLILGSNLRNKIPYRYPYKKRVRLRKWYMTCWMYGLFDQARVCFHP
jgi:hypothetical protein